MTAAGTILIADDDPLNRETLQALLAAQPYALAFATDGREALEQARRLRPDVLLLDVMMPEMTGFEVCAALRADPALAEMPVIMITALDDRASRLKGFESGADEFLTKPFDRVELRMRLQLTLRLNRYRRLMSERAKFEWVIEHAQEGYLLLDSAGVIQFANAPARRHLGLPAGAAADASFLDTARAHFRCEPEGAWSQWPGAGPARFLVRPATTTAPACWLRVDALPLPGAAGETLVRLHDATGEIDLQRQVWSFHAAISHKLRTPLTGLMGSLELLSKSTARLTPQEVAELAQVALHCANRLHEGVQDVTEYAQAPATAREGQISQVRGVRSIVPEVCAEAGIQPAAVRGDAALDDLELTLSQRALETILREVLHNTRKFHPRQAPHVEVEIDRPDARTVRLRVRDDGRHVPAAELGNVWKPYYQSESRFTGNVPGMGLGLALVSALLAEVGGSGSMANRTDGPGVVVELNLPLAPKHHD